MEHDASELRESQEDNRLDYASLIIVDVFSKTLIFLVDVEQVLKLHTKAPELFSR